MDVTSINEGTRLTVGRMAKSLGIDRADVPAIIDDVRANRSVDVNGYTVTYSPAQYGLNTANNFYGVFIVSPVEVPSDIRRHRANMDAAHTSPYAGQPAPEWTRLNWATAGRSVVDMRVDMIMAHGVPYPVATAMVTDAHGRTHDANGAAFAPPAPAATATVDRATLRTFLVYGMGQDATQASSAMVAIDAMPEGYSYRAAQWSAWRYRTVYVVTQYGAALHTDAKPRGEVTPAMLATIAEVPAYGPDSDADDETTAIESGQCAEHAGVSHVSSGHPHGTLYGCPACEATCHCDPRPGNSECIWSGHDDNPFNAPMGQGWACDACALYIANGETPAELSEAEESDWLANFHARNPRGSVTVDQDDVDSDVERDCDTCGVRQYGTYRRVDFWPVAL